MGSGIQIGNCEPHGEPFLSLHQNHYHNPVGTSIGAIKFCAQDGIGAEIRCKMDGPWSATSRPTSLAFYLTQENFATPRFQALGINESGQVALGGLEHLPSRLVSLGIYRKGTLQLPKVDKLSDLTKFPHTDGMLMFVSNLGRTALSEGGKWKLIATEDIAD